MVIVLYKVSVHSNILTRHQEHKGWRSLHQTEEEETVQPISSDTIIPEKLLLAPEQSDIMTEIEHLNLQNPPPPEYPANLTYVPESIWPRLLSKVHVMLRSSWNHRHWKSAQEPILVVNIADQVYPELYHMQHIQIPSTASSQFTQPTYTT